MRPGTRMPSEDLDRMLTSFWGPGAARLGGSGEASYLVLPNAREPRYIVPLQPAGAAGAILRSYPGMRTLGVRWQRQAVGAAIGERLRWTLRADTVTVDEGEDSLIGHLRWRLDAADLAVAVSFGRRGPNRKPVLQLWDPARRRSIAFVKLGWDEHTRALVRNEARALRALDRPQAGFRAPDLLLESEWRGIAITAITPLPPDASMIRGAPPEAVARAIGRLEAPERETLGRSRYWRALRRRLDACEGSALHREVAARVRGVEARAGEAEIPFGAWHGDWVPWNLARSVAGVYVIDWEHHADSVPAGFDLLHHRFQRAFIARRRSVAQAVGRVELEASALPGKLDLSAAEAATIAPLYVLEMILRAVEASARGAGVNKRFLPAILSVFDELVS